MLNNYVECRFFLAFRDNIRSADSIFVNLDSDNIETHKLQNISLHELKSVFREMDCVIGGDTGLTYLAWVLQTPCITLYGNKIGTNKKSKNMKDTSLDRILLGNPYLVSKSDTFEIASISPKEIFTLIKQKIL